MILIISDRITLSKKLPRKETHKNKVWDGNKTQNRYWDADESSEKDGKLALCWDHLVYFNIRHKFCLKALN